MCQKFFYKQKLSIINTLRKEDSAFANGFFVSPYRVVDMGLKMELREWGY
jgi:hypothetical protein